MNNISIYHQCGFRYKWNKEINEEFSIGDGFILSPLDMSKETLSDIPDDKLSSSFFDPQFYSLNLYKDNYLSYRFLDEIDSIYDYSVSKNQIAKKCIDFQNNISLKYLTIPTIDFNLLNLNESYNELYNEIKSDSDEPSYFSNSNIKNNLYKKLILDPFCNYIKNIETNKKVLATMIFDDEMAKDENLFNSFLATITGNDIISGIYLLPQNNRTFKRISDINFLTKIMEFIHILRENDLEVIIGYSDIESILYTVAGATAVPIGIYENLRKYDGLKFSNNDYNGRGPNPRIFSSKLLQWIEYPYLPVIKENDDLSKYFEQNDYFFETQEKDYNWHFSKPQCYKHYMISFSNLINDLPSDLDERYQYVDKLLEQANNAFNELSNFVFFDNNSNGDHINKWRTALKSYYTKIKE